MKEYDLKMRGFSKVPSGHLGPKESILTNEYSFYEEIMKGVFQKVEVLMLTDYCLRDSIHRIENFGFHPERKGGLREGFIMLKVETFKVY